MANEDRLLAASPASASPTLQYVLKALARPSLEWLASQPATFVAEELFLCHGASYSDETYLLEGMSQRGGFLNVAGKVLPSDFRRAGSRMEVEVFRVCYTPDTRV
jgi:hypothetical protein